MFGRRVLAEDHFCISKQCRPAKHGLSFVSSLLPKYPFKCTCIQVPIRLINVLAATIFLSQSNYSITNQIAETTWSYPSYTGNP